MKLVWSKSGDQIECTPLDQGFVEFWLDKQSTLIWTTKSIFPQAELIAELNVLLAEISGRLAKVKIVLVDMPITGIDQNQLNILHRNWVLMHKQHPNISALFGDDFRVSLDRINIALHDLEESWKARLHIVHDPISVDCQRPEFFGKSNLEIPHQNLGRCSYNKWSNFDTSVHTIDTNNFDELHTIVSMNLSQPYITEAPREYAAWCDLHNIKATPNTLMLANFVNIDCKLETYRALFMKNFVLDNNDVIFTL